MRYMYSKRGVISIQRILLVVMMMSICNYAFSQVNLTNGLIAYYPLNGTATDASGNNLNGVIMGNPQPTTDRFNNPNSAMRFDGANDYIVVNDAGKLSTKAITVAAMINTEVAGGQMILGKIEYGTGYAATYNLGINYDVQYGYFFGTTPFTASCFQQYLYDPSNPFARTTNNFSTNQWHCLVGSFENNTLKIYVDGVLADVKTTTYQNLLECTNTQLLIGSWWAGDPLRFKGKIDDVRIYNRALNTDEVAALCEVQNTLCNGTLGDPVVNITFGSGNNPASDLPTTVPGASTTLNYLAVTGNPATPVPNDGQYTITNNVPANQGWFMGAPDHTPGDNNGYMAFYNSQATAGLEFYKQTISNLCGGTSYEFAAWVANCLDLNKGNGVDPDVTFQITKLDGTVLGSYTTGPITESTSMTWRQYGFYFTLPTTESSVILKMINNAPGGAALPGNDLAIDDITFRPCGPLSTASLDPVSKKDSVSICEGSSIQLYGTIQSGYSTPAYRWQVSTGNNAWTDIPNSNALSINVTPNYNNGTYVIYRMVAAESTNINSINCRITTNILYARVNQLPDGNLVGDTICANTQAKLLFHKLKGVGPFTISYQDPQGNLIVQPNIESDLTFNAPNILTANANYKLLSITDKNGCINSPSSNTDAVVAIQPAIFNTPKGGSICFGKSITLDGANGSQSQYTWSPASTLSNASIVNPVARPTTTTTYQVAIVSSTCGYQKSFDVEVAVLPLPDIAVTKSNDITCDLPYAQLTASGGVSYVWSPASTLADAGAVSTKATPTTSTTYLVTGTGANGCTDTASIYVDVNKTGRPVFAVPNAFTPNGDGKNDCFGIRSWANVNITEFSVFNRWGLRLFSTKDASDCWNGKFRGEAQPAGGYTYVIKGEGLCGPVIRTGIVILVR